MKDRNYGYLFTEKGTEKGSHKSYFLYMHSLELLYSSYGEDWGGKK